jgi:hypothetical protein
MDADTNETDVALTLAGCDRQNKSTANPLMGWSGRAPAPSAIKLARGSQREGARYA